MPLEFNNIVFLIDNFWDSQQAQSPLIFSIKSGPVAQRLEQGTHNPLVLGSNPSGPTTYSSCLPRFCKNLEFFTIHVVKFKYLN